VNQLCKLDTAQLLFETARRYHASQEWYPKLVLLMPDHLHMLIGISPDGNLSKLIRDFKRIAARRGKIECSEIFSITDCARMKVNRKSLNTFGRIRCELD
jgi:REP element-mobilizing transposase RayT